MQTLFIAPLGLGQGQSRLWANKTALAGSFTSIVTEANKSSDLASVQVNEFANVSFVVDWRGMDIGY